MTTDFDSNIRDLFRQTADAMPSSGDLTKRILDKLHENKASQSRRISNTSRGVTVGNFSVAAVVILIVGMLAYVFAQHSPSRIASTHVETPGIVGHVAPVTDQGVTLQIVSAYADPLGTAVQVAISGTNQQLHFPELQDPTLTLTDSAGKSFTFTTAMTGGQGGYFGVDPRNQVARFDYLPLPMQQLQGPLQAIFVVHTLTLATGVKPPSTLPPLTGTWKSAFTVNPLAGKSYTYAVFAVVHQGIGMQVQSLEIASPNQMGVAPTGGVRLMLIITGLPANTLIQSFYGWYPYATPPGHSSPVCPVPPCHVTQLNPPRALLTIPGFAVHAGNNGISFPVPLSSDETQTDGNGGTVQVELLYPGQGTPDGSMGALTITNLQLLMANGNQTGPKETLLSTWTLEMPLH